MQITPVIERILTRAAERPDYTVISRHGDALMDMQTHGLMDRGALTARGLAAAQEISSGLDCTPASAATA